MDERGRLRGRAMFTAAAPGLPGSRAKSVSWLLSRKPPAQRDEPNGASTEAVTNAFRILISDEDVKAVLINIFGGIVRCDRVAEGIIEAAKQVDINVPLVVRLQGTNAKEARRMLEKSDLSLGVADAFDEAAKKIVQAVRGGA
jgi:succinyl-CoA synthetase beta subunit